MLRYIRGAHPDRVSVDEAPRGIVTDSMHEAFDVWTSFKIKIKINIEVKIGK